MNQSARLNAAILRTPAADWNRQDVKERQRIEKTEREIEREGCTRGRWNRKLEEEEADRETGEGEGAHCEWTGL